MDIYEIRLKNARALAAAKKLRAAGLSIRSRKPLKRNQRLHIQNFRFRLFIRKKTQNVPFWYLQRYRLGTIFISRQQREVAQMNRQTLTDGQDIALHILRS
jgi:hypothetical protein